MSGVEARKVALLAGISAALWNAMLVGAGMVLGYHLDELVGFVTQYTRWVLIILGVILVLFVLKSTLLKRSSASEEIDPK
jgi:membrane-associated protein